MATTINQSAAYWKGYTSTSRQPLLMEYLEAMKESVGVVDFVSTQLRTWIGRYVQNVKTTWNRRVTVGTNEDVRDWFNEQKHVAVAIQAEQQIYHGETLYKSHIRLKETKRVLSDVLASDAPKPKKSRPLDLSRGQNTPVATDVNDKLSSRTQDIDIVGSDDEVDVIEDTITWHAGEPPSWFQAARTKYFELRQRREFEESISSKALYWRIIDLTNFSELKSYLKPIEIKAVRDLFSLSVPNLSDFKVFSNAEYVLSALEEISPYQVIEVCKVVRLTGPVGGLRKLASLLQTNLKSTTSQPNMKAYNADRLKDILGTNVPKMNDSATKVAELVSLYDSSGEFDDDVRYVFNLFNQSYEMIEKGIPCRDNTERALDSNYFWDMFACLESVSAIHYGEAVSRASRFRRRLSSPQREGFHVDYIFKSLQSQIGAYGDEFALCENAGSSLNHDEKSKTDFFKLAKTMRDTHLSLCRNLLNNAQSLPKFVKALDVLRIVGFRTSGFKVTSSILIPAGGGFYVRGMVDEVVVPVATKNLQDNCAVARAILKMKNTNGA
ncbi:hypothetical protein HDU81_005224 [Chytriomyces hyalinus]|nr:hypothetical protein HDU81_005224 [Chytriomyces hyalinus]